MDKNEHTLEPENARIPDDDSPTLVDKPADDDSPTLVDVPTENAPPAQPADVSDSLEPPDIAEDFNYRAYASTYDLPIAPDESLDIDAALAAVASLSDVVAEQEAVEQKQQQAAAAREAARTAPRYTLPMPPTMTLRRAHPASLFPALLLIGLGAWLTFVLTSTGTLPDGRLLTAVVGGSLIALLVVAWLNYRGWSRGVFFLAANVMLIGGGLYANDYLGFHLALPIVLGAIGVAFALTAYLSRPRDRRLLLPALIFIAAALTAELMAEAVISQAFVNGVTRSWFVVPIVLIVLWVLPLIFRRRRS